MSEKPAQQEVDLSNFGGRDSPEPSSLLNEPMTPESERISPINAYLSSTYHLNTPGTGSKVIERCLTDLDELIVRRKKELNDIQKSGGGFKSIQKNKIKHTESEENQLLASLPPVSTTNTRLSRSIFSTSSVKTSNKTLDSEFEKAIRSSLNTATAVLNASKEISSHNNSTSTHTNHHNSNIPTIKRPLVFPSAAKSSKSAAEIEKALDMSQMKAINGHMSVMSAMKNSNLNSTLNSSFLKSTTKSTSTVTKTVQHTTQKKTSAVQQNGAATKENEHQNGVHSTPYSQNNHTNDHTNNHTNNNHSYAHDENSYNYHNHTAGQSSAAPGSDEKEKLQKLLKAANAKIAVLEEKLQLMELHVEGNMNGNSQRNKILAEEKTKLQAQRAQLQDDLDSANETINFIRSQLQHKSEINEELEADLTRAYRRIQDLQEMGENRSSQTDNDLHNMQNVQGRSLFADQDPDPADTSFVSVSSVSLPKVEPPRAASISPIEGNVQSDNENLMMELEMMKLDFDQLKVDFDQLKSDNDETFALYEEQKLDFLRLNADYEALKTDFTDQQNMLFVQQKLDLSHIKSDFDVQKSDYEAALNENQLLAKYLEDALKERNTLWSKIDSLELATQTHSAAYDALVFEHEAASAAMDNQLVLERNKHSDTISELNARHTQKISIYKQRLADLSVLNISSGDMHHHAHAHEQHLPTIEEKEEKSVALSTAKGDSIVVLSSANEGPVFPPSSPSFEVGLRQRAHSLSNGTITTATVSASSPPSATTTGVSALSAAVVTTDSNCSASVGANTSTSSGNGNISLVTVYTAENNFCQELCVVPTVAVVKKRSSGLTCFLFVLAWCQLLIWLGVILVAYLYFEHLVYFGQEPIRIVPYRFTS